MGHTALRRRRRVSAGARSQSLSRALSRFMCIVRLSSLRSRLVRTVYSLLLYTSMCPSLNAMNVLQRPPTQEITNLQGE
eukprot:18514-Eustigmatos_ZCMA.PRE.1